MRCAKRSVYRRQMTVATAARILESYADPTRLPASEPLRLAKLLALDVATRSHVQLARQISVGLRPGAESTLVWVLGRKQVIGPVIPEATLRRARKAGRPLSKQASERLYGIYRVFDAVGRAYHGDAEAMRNFLKSPHALLEGETPLDLAGTGSAGANAVVDLVRRAEAGVAL